MAITDYKTCWSCLKKTMVKCPELGGEWFKCSKCGATYIKMPKTRASSRRSTYKIDGISHYSPRPKIN